MECERCDAKLEQVLGAPISSIGIYREVIGYRCPIHDWQWRTPLAAPGSPKETDQ